MKAWRALLVSSGIDGTVARLVREAENTEDFFDFFSDIGTLLAVDTEVLSNLDDLTDKVVATEGTDILVSLELRIENALPPPADRTAEAESK